MHNTVLDDVIKLANYYKNTLMGNYNNKSNLNNMQN